MIPNPYNCKRCGKLFDARDAMLTGGLCPTCYEFIVFCRDLRVRACRETKALLVGICDYRTYEQK